MRRSKFPYQATDIQGKSKVKKKSHFNSKFCCCIESCSSWAISVASLYSLPYSVLFSFYISYSSPAKFLTFCTLQERSPGTWWVCVEEKTEKNQRSPCSRGSSGTIRGGNLFTFALRQKPHSINNTLVSANCLVSKYFCHWAQFSSLKVMGRLV